MMRCCLTCKNRTSGKGYDFSYHDIICHLKFEKPKLWRGFPVTEAKFLLFDAKGLTKEEIEKLLMLMGNDCPYWKPEKECEK